MSKKAWIIFAAICALLLGTLVVLADKEKINVDGVDITAVQPASDQTGNIADHVFGPSKSKVTLIEYGDYQCPGCGSAYPVIKSITDKYKDQLSFVFRNFPLTTMHPNARIAAAVAEAAGLQGKYWQMHDKLYTNQSDWNSLSADTRVDRFVSYAKELNLDTTKFRADLNSDAIAKKIAFDQALGDKAKVTGTPSFYLNGKPVDQYVKDGKIVPATTADAQPIWGDAASFEKLLLIPAFKEAGITLPADAQ